MRSFHALPHQTPADTLTHPSNEPSTAPISTMCCGRVRSDNLRSQNVIAGVKVTLACGQQSHHRPDVARRVTCPTATQRVHRGLSGRFCIPRSSTIAGAPATRIIHRQEMTPLRVMPTTAAARMPTPGAVEHRHHPSAPVRRGELGDVRRDRLSGAAHGGAEENAAEDQRHRVRGVRPGCPATRSTRGRYRFS